MKVVIMQPTYLPWIGYFSLIEQADYFVFLDNVQFEKQSWQQRNKILTNKGLEWLTVPVLIKGRFGQVIKDVEISSAKFAGKHIKQIKQNYSKAPFFEKLGEQFFGVLQEASEGHSLCDLNISLIRWICRKLGITTKFFNASEMSAEGTRSALLVNIISELSAKNYLSPLDSLKYIKEDYDIFKQNEISVAFEQYKHPEYKQVNDSFTPYASIIDLLFNEDDNSKSIILSGQKENLKLEEMI
jgi:hypothetical protein